MQVQRHGIGRDRAAVHALEESAPLEGSEIPADRLGCHIELFSESSDLDSAPRSRGVEDGLLAFGGVHTFIMSHIRAQTQR